jgi:L-ascorbate metabolism protein UlaG (beta-lactamase superfamily)
LIRPAENTRTEPWLWKKQSEPALAPEALGRVDMVLLSHDHHRDNLDHSGRTFLASVSRVITTREGAERLGGNSVGLAAWQSIDIAERGAVTGFVVALADAPGSAIFMRAARVPVVGPFALTMTAEDGVQAAHAFSEATIVPIHVEGWKHLSESREVISRAFEAAGVSGRVRWMEAGTVVDVGG